MGKRSVFFSVIFALLALMFPGYGEGALDLFHPYVVLKTGSYPEAVAIGDLNNDGRSDVVMSTSSYLDPENDYRIHLFLQDTRGKLMDPVKYPGGNGSSLDIGDLNDDGRDDIVLSYSNGIGVYLQNPEGTLEPMVEYPSNHESESNSRKVRIGDFNNDGKMDVVSIDRGSASSDVDIFLQREHGKLNAPLSYAVEHGEMDDLVVGDVNNDGLTDIVVMSGSGIMYDNMGILLQNIRGTFDRPYYYDLGKHEITHGAAVGDVNGDNLQDVVVTYGEDSPTSYIGIFSQNDAGKLDTRVNCYPSLDMPNTVETGDVNFDGKSDVIVAHAGQGSLSVFLQDDDGSLAPYLTYGLPTTSRYNPHGMALGDINGDGAADVVIADHNQGLVLLYHTAPPEPVADLTGSWDDLSVDYRSDTILVSGIFGVKNQGTNEAVGVRVAYYLSEDPVLDERDTLFRRHDIGSLSPGESMVVPFDFTSEIYLQGEYLIAVVDPLNGSSEKNKENNLATTPIAQMTKVVRTVEVRKAMSRRSCPTSYCNLFIKKIKEFYR